MTPIKKIILGLIPRSIKDMKAGVAVVHKRNPTLSIKEIILKCKLVNWNSKLDYRDDYVRQFDIISKKIRLNTSSFYVYPLTYRMHNRKLIDIGSITVDFGKILESDVRELNKALGQTQEKSFALREKRLLKGIEALCERITNKLRKENDSRALLLASYFEQMLYRQPESFDEAENTLL